MTTNESICIKCGNKKRIIYFPFCRPCTPYLYGKGKYPHQVIRRSIDWTFKRAKRIEDAEKKCEWCEKKPDNGLTVHHKTGVNPIVYQEIWEALVELKSNELRENNKHWKEIWDRLNQKDSLEEIQKEIQENIKNRAQREQVKSCPNCDGSQLSERKYQKPKYYCSNCKSEFNTPKTRPTKKYNKNQIQLNFLTQKRIKEMYINEVVTSFYDEIKEEYESNIKKVVQDYLSMENTIVLCKKCHWNAENNRILCSKCKKHYNKYNIDKCKACEEEERRNMRKFNLNLLDNEAQLLEIKTKLRTEQKNKCYKCGAKLYNLDFSIPLRKWKQECWKCGRQTEVVSYVISDEMDNCIIGSHEKVDAILRDEYSFIEKLYSTWMKRWTTGNKCVHCGAFQGNGYIEHDLVWDRGVYYNDYDEIFPIERILSIGHILYLDKNEENKDIENLKLICFDCFEQE